MKHLKEFKLNENTIHKGANIDSTKTIDLENVKNCIIGALIDDYEYTDVVLSNPKVEQLIVELAREKMSRIKYELYYISEWTKFENMVEQINVIIKK